MKQLTIDGLIRRVGRLTQNNDHNESVMELAKFLNEQDAIDKMESIIKRHERLGHMPYELIQERMRIMGELMKKVELTYGYEIKKKLYSKF